MQSLDKTISYLNHLEEQLVLLESNHLKEAKNTTSYKQADFTYSRLIEERNRYKERLRFMQQVGKLKNLAII